MKQEVLLKAEELSFGYGKGPLLLRNIDLTVNRGDIFAITGASGCGKTTLFACLSGMIPHMTDGKLRGRIRVLEIPLSELTPAHVAQHVGVVFHDLEPQLFPGTLLENLLFAPENFCVSRAEMERRLEDLCKRLPIKPLLRKRADLLSDGQKQLAAIASVLMMQTEILLLDEVFSCLDAEDRILVSRELLRLKRSGCGILMIDHTGEALRIADRVFCMEKGALFEQTIH